MKLEELLKTSLDELRMQMLGAQVLFGFQLQGVFQEGFSQTTTLVRRVDAAGLALIVLTLALLIAAPSQHRLIDGGRVTIRIYRASTKFANIALAPFAAALGCDFYVIGERYWGRNTALGIALLMTVTAIMAWYGLGTILRLRTSTEVKTVETPQEKETTIHTKIEHMLTEARVVLPGAQALLGFQFVVTMTDAFSRLPVLDRNAHFIGLAMVALSIMLLIAPAAIHRLTFRGKDTERFHRIGSALVTLALFPLTLGIGAEFYVASSKMLDSRPLAAFVSGAVFVTLLVLWYAVPLMMRSRKTPASPI